MECSNIPYFDKGLEKLDESGKRKFEYDFLLSIWVMA